MKFLLKAFLAVIFLVIAGISYAIYSYKSKAETYIKEVITLSAKRSNVNVAFDEFGLNVIGMKAKAVNLFVPKAFLSLKIDNPRVEFPILAALMLKPGVNLSSKFYEGDVSANASYNYMSSETSGWFRLERLDLGKMIQFSSFGITSGIVNVSIPEFKADSSGPKYMKGDYSLQGLRIMQDIQLPPAIAQNLGYSMIPRTEDLNLSGSLLFENGAFNLNNGNLTSDLGNSKYELNVLFNQNGSPESIKINSGVKLSQKGLQYFGYLLPEISNNILSSSQSNFTVSIEGNARKLKYSFRPQ